ncbi:MAG TPA: methyltransferase domain-containing protein, partial [Vicinamibacterales bacterium]|nr:methyltransferase domain-containing protein [Vicinamibacterales bacterium]
MRLKGRLVGPRPTVRPPATEIIREHIARLGPSADLKIVFGGHWSNNPGWLLLTEADQDITARLQFDDRSVDVVFAEHVIEHVPLVGGVRFLQESARILKPGGICRIVCPMLDRMIRADFGDANGAVYMENSLRPFFRDEERVLQELGLTGLAEDPLPFFFGFLYMGHGHRFIWTSGLMIKVMKAAGFRDATCVNVGEGRRRDACIERRRRGVYLGYNWEEELVEPHATYDVESFVVEG